MTVPTPQHASALLARAADAEARVRREASPASSGFLLTLGLASAGYLTAQPIAAGDRGVLAATAVFVPAVVGAALALVLGRRTARRGFERRFGVVMALWAVAFATGLSVGTTTFPSSWAYWLPVAAAVALPCLLGAWRELPR